jgi:predicted RNA methylase
MDDIKSFCNSRRGFREFMQMNKDTREMFKESAIDLLENREGLERLCEDIVKFSSVRMPRGIFYESGMFYFPNSHLIHPSVRGRPLSIIYSDLYTTQHALFEFPHPYQLIQQLSILVKELRDRRRLTLDLFSGSGIDSLGLATISDKIIGVDIEKYSVALARINSKRFMDISDIHFINADATTFKSKESPDLIYCDPPWGIDYKKNKDMPLYIGGKELSELCDEIIKEYPKARLLVKLPKNYQFFRLEHIPLLYHKIFKKDGVEVSYYIGLY